MIKRWTYAPPADAALLQQLSASLNISPLLAQLLINRGITDFESAKKFFRPSYTDLHDPFLMKDMHEAVDRIEHALREKEKILVYGDYDVDGTTAVALVYSYLQSIGADAAFYIPNRYTEGYGVSMTGMDFAAENNFKLVITLDCGIKDGPRIAYAKEKGIDVIVCDHHRPGEILPPALAVLDPKRDDCTYPYKELSGCGIGFKLVQALAVQRFIEVVSLQPYLDLVAVSIAADVVPMTGENRVLAYYGLKRINSYPRAGFDVLIKQNGQKQELGISDLVYILAPRINAAGRIEHGSRAVELLTATETSVAESVAELINRNNLERKDLDTSITQQAFELLAAKPEWIARKSTVVFNPAWHKGVVGIVASRLTEKYYRPTIVLTESNGLATGSARSVKDFDIYEAIEACSDLLEQFGGHKYAAGLSLKPENVEAFRDRFETIVSSTITDAMLVPEVEIDAEIEFSEIDPKLLRILKQFSPFGPDNPNPVFATKHVYDRGWAQLVGSNHLKLELMHESLPSRSFPAIAFNMGEWYPQISMGQPFNACYTLEENEWNGNITLQLNVRDIAI